MRKHLAILLLLAAGAARAQDEREPAERRDPFAPGGELRDGEGGRFVARDAPPALPALALKGYVEDEAGRAVALLEVDGESTYLVRKGDTVSLPRGGENLVMRIVELTNLELRLEIGELRRVVVVR